MKSLTLLKNTHLLGKLRSKHRRVVTIDIISAITELREINMKQTLN